MEKINEFSYKEKRSEFITYLFLTDDKEEAEKKISEIKKLHHKARHALSVLNLDNDSIAKEDGEPIKSMHLVLEYMKKNEIKNKLIIIVRYYGGVNLGQSRLAKVYYELALKVLNL